MKNTSETQEKLNPEPNLLSLSSQPREEIYPDWKKGKLNQKQILAHELVLAGQSIFLTGAAGTGKSFLLRQIITALQQKYGGEQVGITSTTGTGAIIIGGNTIHSYLGIGVVGHLTPEFLLTRILSLERARENWKRIKVLVIDEVSMLDGELFTKLENLARTIRKDNQPFGGIQLVLVGDFCQLSPVGKSVTSYCFEVPAWTKCINQTVNLTQIYRQKKNWFVRYLQMIRFGRLPKRCWEDMLQRLSREPNWPEDGIKPISLFSKNQEVGDLNEKELAQLPADSYIFRAEDKEKIPNKLSDLVKSCLAPTTLELKVGAQVMLIKNWYEKNLVNGSQGVVIGFLSEEDSTPYPIVKFTNGKELVIEEHTWEKVESYDAKNKPLISATRTQIPLILSWAITIHKCQGQSIERLKVDLNSCFMGGQVYTALSRATNPDYCQILNFSYQRLWCEQKVKDFYHSLTSGETVKSRSKKKTNWHKEYLKDKAREKFKEFRVIYQQTSEWPYEKIKELLNQQKREYFRAFCQVVEKSISNSQNLVTYRQLLEYLNEWWKEKKRIK